MNFTQFSYPNQPAPTDPIEIFLRLPKAPGFDDLRNGQAEALRAWYKRRSEKDIVIKLNTGGGKTLVGLLIAQSFINEQDGPVLYLCPTRQLRDQIVRQSEDYGIPTVPYVSGRNIPEEFFANQAVLVGTYQALFNGQSKFGISGASTTPIDLRAIVLDDAHTAFATMREIFSLQLTKRDHPTLYEELTTLFRPDFARQGRQGTFDDIISERDDVVLEIPYVSWINRSEEIREKIADIGIDSFPFVWPLIRDSFQHCHAFMDENEFVITPLLPMVDMFPSFTDCLNRVHMSATVADDSSIIRTFGSASTSVSKPITPHSLAGVGERMILMPEMMDLALDEKRVWPETIVAEMSKESGVVILVPSTVSSKQWSHLATTSQGDDVAVSVSNLINGTCYGPYVFPNRYDGIDLPGNSCRLLIISGMPRGSNIYDKFRETVLKGSGPVEATKAQKIEQGIGRGTRGGGDHCIVILLGKELVGWVNRPTNQRLLTSMTRVQIEMGIQTSAAIDSTTTLDETVAMCLDRSPEWMTYHANRLADATSRPLVDQGSLNIAAIERRYFSHAKMGRHTRAIGSIEQFISDTPDLDRRIRGWLLQLAARSAHLNHDVTRRDELQGQAFSCNTNLVRPPSEVAYRALVPPSTQAEAIVENIKQFAHPKAALLEFDTVVDYLTATATSNQFEESMKILGDVLGFGSSRPDNEFGNGPDNLWLMNNKIAWIIEVKSRKQVNSPLRRKEHGQLLQSEQWFVDNHSDYTRIRIVLHPNAEASESVTIGSTQALTLNKLGELIGSVRMLLEDLISCDKTSDELIVQCEQRLRELNLTPRLLSNTFLSPFTQK